MIFLFSAIALLAQVDTIYPGDANNDGFCNQTDIVVLGMEWQSAGPPRDSFPTSDWVPTPSNSWSDSLYNGFTVNYADCNGNGVVEGNDYQVVIQNFGLKHDTTLAKTYGFTFIPGTSNDPPIELDLSTVNQDSVFVSDTLRIPIVLGNAAMQVDLVGISSDVIFCNNTVDTAWMDYDTSWISPNISRLDFDRFTSDTAGNDALSIASVKTTLGNTSGFGAIGVMIIVMEGNIAGKTTLLSDTACLCFDNVLAIRADGSTDPLFAGCDTFLFHDRELAIPPPPTKADIIIYPNPSEGTFTIKSKNAVMKNLLITNILGQTIAHKELEGGHEEIIFDRKLPSGLYTVSVGTDKGLFTHKLEIAQ